MNTIRVTVLRLLATLFISAVLGAYNDPHRNGNEGAQILVRCAPAIQSQNLSMIHWVHEDETLLTWNMTADEEWYVKDKEDTRFTFDQDSCNLLITELKLSDQGKYVCRGYQEVVTNLTDMEQQVVFEYTTIITVKGRPLPPPHAPNITDVTQYTLHVSWAHSPDEPNQPVKEYVVYTRLGEKPDKLEVAVVPASRNETIISGLQPYTSYYVYVAARNDVGPSKFSLPSKLVKTREALPSKTAKPRITKFENYTTAIYVEFKHPPLHMLNGKLLGYLLKISNQESPKNLVEAKYDPNLTSFNFTGLTPYTLYMVSIKVFNDAGEGPEVVRAVRTEEDVPDHPRILHIKLYTYSSLLVVWEAPKKTNGVLLGYRLFWRDKEQESNVTLGPQNSYNITNLSPYQEYIIQIAARTSRGYGNKSDPPTPAVTDVKGPSAPVITNITVLSSTSIQIEWSRPNITYRGVNQYRLQYRPLGGGDGEVDWKIETMSQTEQNSQEDSKAVIGMLKPNTVYEIRIAGETKSLFSDRYYTGDFSERRTVNLSIQGEDNNQTGQTPASLVVGVLAGILVTLIVLFIAGLVLVVLRRYMKRSYHFIANPDSNGTTDNVITLPESYDDTEHEPILVESWAEHVANLHADTDLKFSQEYEEINRNVRTDLTFDHSADPENKNKNRYTNIIAYDHSRVILKQLPGKPKQSDYINANYVDGYHRPKAYIATQGPLTATFGDFWRMVWEQNSLVICMITNLTERGRRKCDQYWPNEGEVTYGQLSVKLLNTYRMAHYTVRVFTLKNLKVKRKGAAERLVFQYHYTDWPDHGVPDFTLPVLMYVRKSVAAAGDSAGPIIIHCSAGVGRTGTYMVLDSMMRQIKDKGSLNVYGFLTHIRNQRNYLVQTEDQYIFIHDALLEYIQSGGETEVKDSNTSKYCEDLLRVNSTKQTLLEKQFKLVTSFQPCDFHLTSAMLPANLMKNRSKQILPVELSRVRLPAQPGEEGSDYINASFLQGYNSNEEYIVTQHPLKSTIMDFWRMVWDRNSTTVVILSQTDAEEYVEFWPAKSETMDCGNFKVTFTEEEEHPNHHDRDFLLESTQDDYECTMRMIFTSYWPDSCVPLSTTFDIIQTVKTSHQERQQVDAPIVVVDKFGGTEAGTFCALSTIYDQLHQEGSIDIYMVAKLYHLKRPGIFGRQEDYHFLYKALESVCEDSTPAGDRDSGISNCANYPATMPAHFPENDIELTKIQRAETTM